MHSTEHQGPALPPQDVQDPNTSVPPPPAPSGAAATSVELRPLLYDPWANQEHHHDTAELVLNFASSFGEIAWKTPTGEVRNVGLGQNHCCLIPAGVRHLVSGIHVEGAVSVLVGGVLLAHMLQRNVTEVVVESVHHLASGDRAAFCMLSELVREPESRAAPAVDNALVLALGLRIIHFLLYFRDGYTNDMAGFSPEEKKRVSNFLRTHLTEKLSLDAIARSVGMSRSRFTRCFRVSYGTSPLQHTLRLRVDEGLRMLSDGARIAEAAHAVGFCDQSHFDRHCRKFYGAPPSGLLRR